MAASSGELAYTVDGDATRVDEVVVVRGCMYVDLLVAPHLGAVLVDLMATQPGVAAIAMAYCVVKNRGVCV